MASFPELKTWSYFFTPQPDGRKRLYEVHFPHNYVQYDPCGATPTKDTTFQLPVSMVCHATHEEQANRIKLHDDGHYHFTPHKKFGKSYIEDGRPLGESYRCTVNHTPDEDTPCYQHIPDDEPIFPGYYSWWGLALDQPPHLPPWIESKVLPPYLKSPPESVYGNVAFKCSFHDLMESYASSRNCTCGDIYLKMGGTLRYKREIAYVVIVCTSRDQRALNSYKPITQVPSDVFDADGLVNEDGKVIDMTRVPYFTTRHMNTFVSYETLNFAFYFSKAKDLRCPLDIIEVSEIKHEFCIRSKPIATWFDRDTRKFIVKRLCSHMEKNRRKHDEAISFARTYGVEWKEIV